MCDMIEVNQVRFMGTEEILAFQAVFDLFQDTREHEIFTVGGNNLGISAMGNATKDLFSSEELGSPGGFNRYSL